MLAASNGHTDAVNALAGTHNANVEAAYAFGNTALMLAAENGHTDTVNVLVGTHNATAPVAIHEEGEPTIGRPTDRDLVGDL